MTKLSTELIKEIQSYRVVNGQDAGSPVRLMGWQRDFLKRVFAPDVGTACLSMGRGAGKTSTVAFICSSALSGVLAQPGSEIAVVASSIKQARIIFDAVMGLLAIPRERRRGWVNADRYRVRNSIAEMMIEDLQTETRMRLLSSDSGRAAGLQASLVIGDEGSSWKSVGGERLHNLLLTSLGKVPGSRYIAISTRPMAESDHFFERFLASADVSMCFAAGKDDDPGKVATWLKAIPSLRRFPELKKALAREYREAEKDQSSMQRFKALRLNQGIADVFTPNLVVEVEAWKGVEVAELPEAKGRRVLGLDLSDGVAMCAGAMVHENGRTEGVVGFPEKPSIEERERKDRCPGAYAKMVEEGTLVTTPGSHIKVADFLREVIDRFGMPHVIVCDRYRQRELVEALAGWRIPVEWRGQGYVGASEDLRRFRRRIMARWVKVQPLAMWRWAMSNARTLMDAAGNEKLVKTGTPGAGRSRRGRDDACAAAVLAVAHADRCFGDGTKRKGASWRIW